MLEFRLKKHLNDISFAAEFDSKSKLRREKGRYFLSLDPKNQKDVAQFLTFFRQNLLEFNSHTAEQLSQFDPAFAEPEGKTLLDEINALKAKIPQLTNAADQAKATAALLKAALDEGTDFGNVDSLIKDLNQKEREAEASEIRLGTAQRRITSLEKKLFEAVEKRRKAAYAEQRKKIDAAAREFNAQMEKAYLQFWTAARDLFPKIHELSSNPAFPPEIYSQSYVMNIADSQAIKTLKSFPTISVLPDRLEFDIRRLKNG